MFVRVSINLTSFGELRGVLEFCQLNDNFLGDVEGLLDLEDKLLVAMSIMAC